MADTLLASVPFAVAADAPSADDGDFVVKDVEILFRADKYEFPAEQGGPFEMTPEDIKAALADFPAGGVPITDEHNEKSVFYNVGLGHVRAPTPSADFSRFGVKAFLKKPVVALLPPGKPLKFSGNWCRRTKRLKDVSLTERPRIKDAVAFAAFAAFAKADGVPMETTPHGRSRMQMIHDMAAEGGAVCKGAGAKKDIGARTDDDVGMSAAAFTSSAERDALQAVHDTAAGMGADCDVYSDAPAKKLKGKREDLMAAYSTEFGPPPDPRIKDLEAQLAAIKSERAAEADARKKADEAHFAATVASFAVDGEREVMQLIREGYVLPDVKGQCKAAYVQARTLDLRGQGEAHFSDPHGRDVAMTALDLWRASWRRGEPHRLTEEQLKSRPGGEALFAANDRDPEAAETERLRKAMEERAARANGQKGGR